MNQNENTRSGRVLAKIVLPQVNHKIREPARMATRNDETPQHALKTRTRTLIGSPNL
jgi:hypothetical protein